MVSRIALAVAAAALTLSPVRAATPRPLPTLTAVPLIDLGPKYAHARSYVGDFTFDETDYGRDGGTKHEHVTLTLHFESSYRDADNLGPELQYGGTVNDTQLGNAEQAGNGCSGSGLASQLSPTLLLARLYLDLGRGTYALNTYGITIRCPSPLQPDIIGGFSADSRLPVYNAVICGTMHASDPDDFDQTDSWSFKPVFDNHTAIASQRVPCPQVTPIPNEE